MTKLQDAAFYVWEPGSEVVWQSPENDFYVVRAGEMRIHYSPDAETKTTIRYTDQLNTIGIYNDKDLERFTALGDDVFTWVNNSWFEVRHKEDGDWFSDPFHTLQEAIDHALVAILEEEI